MKVSFGIQLPTRDGTHLSATIYRTAAGAPAPCVLMLTPYGADSQHERAVYFAKQGLHCVVVDVRGRGNSGGLFQPFAQEASDGYDVVEWLAAQPFCNGEVVMSGSSYLGHAQWMTASQAPPALKTLVPAAAPYLGLDFPMRNNIFYAYLAQWLALTTGRNTQIKLFSDRSFWSQVFRQWYISGQPFEQLSRALPGLSSIWDEWLNHPEPDAYWDRHNPTPEQYARVSLPILTITGCYDDDQPGALEHYRLHLANAPAEARECHYLVIGPWDHPGVSNARTEFGGITFGVASAIDLPQLHYEWYRWILQQGPRPPLLKKRVAYYVMGANRWRHADSLSAVTSRHETYFLESAGEASDVLRGGSLQQRNGVGPPDQYTFNPNNRGPWLDAETERDGGSLVDQRLALALSGRLLAYHSAPFERATEISGFFRLTAWIAIDTPDTDFFASIHEVTPEGTVIRLSTDAMRGRYREGLRTPMLNRSNEPLRYEFSRFTFVSREIARGSRLRLLIAPVGHLIDSTFTELNFNAGGRVASESHQVARSVTVTLFHDEHRPSVLRVPIGALPR